MDGLKGILVVIVVFGAMALIMAMFRQPPPFGAGDIKLFLGIGMLWGWKIVSVTIYFSFIVGGLIGFYVYFIKRGTKHSQFAFAPAIIIGLLASLIYTQDIFNYYFPWMSDSFGIKPVKIKIKKPLPKL